MYKTILFLLLIILIFIFLVVNKYEYYIENFKDNNNLICNHYKFKSDEEYNLRQIEYNRVDGYLKHKLDDKININWKKRANSKTNLAITKYVSELKNQMKNSLVQNTKKYYNISVVCMFRYEDLYLEEWIHYYIMHGIEHFFLYSHRNTDNTIKILQPFIIKGYITLIDWKDEELLKIDKKKRRLQYGGIVGFSKTSLQNLAFIDFVKNHKHKTKWIIKIDVDEFIHPENTNIKIKDVLNSTTLKKKKYKVPRIDFGSNNYIKKPKRIIIENYMKSENKSSSHKSIALTKFISKNDKGGCHSFKML